MVRRAGTPLAKEYVEENIELVTAGCCNLARHIENSAMFGVPVVVGVNQFATDTDTELNAVKQAALAAGASPCNLIEQHSLVPSAQCNIVVIYLVA